MIEAQPGWPAFVKTLHIARDQEDAEREHR